MNLHVPLSPGAVRGVGGPAEEASARRTHADGEFAAVLAARADEGEAKSADTTAPDQESGPLGRPRPERTRPATGASTSSAVTEDETRLPHDRGEIHVEPTKRTSRPRLPQSMSTEIEAPSSSQMPGSQDHASLDREASAAAGDLTAQAALSVLGAGLPAQAARVTPSDRAIVLPDASRAAFIRRSTAGQSLAAADRPEETPVELLSVRVVRQEKHFQPVRLDGRREAEGADRLVNDPKGLPGSGAALDSLSERASQRSGAIPRASTARMSELVPSVAAADISAQPGVPAADMGEQIARGVQRMLEEPALAEPADSRQPGQVGDLRQAYAPAIRTLKLQLNPLELGMVTIVLSGHEDGLSIELSADLPNTATQMENDRSSLAARLSGAGYAVTEINVARSAGHMPDAGVRDPAGGTGQEATGSQAREGGAAHTGHQAKEQTHHRAHDNLNRSDGPDGRGRAAQATTFTTGVSGLSYAGRFRPI